jgi:fibrillarin-like rRNA methylase
VKGAREECGFRLTCGLKRSVLYVKGKRGTTVSHALHIIGAALVEFMGIFRLPSFYQDVK